MALTDMSLSNSMIANYFNGSDVYIPSSELIYIHAHPLVKPNFLDQLEALILKTNLVIERKSIRGTIIDKITSLTMKLGAELPDITQENAPKILDHLREIYKICNGLLENNNIVNA